MRRPDVAPPEVQMPAAHHPAQPVSRHARRTCGLLALGIAAVTPFGVHAQEDASPPSLRLAMPWGTAVMRERATGTSMPGGSAAWQNTADLSWRLVGNYDLPRSGLRASGGMIGVSRRTALGAAALQDNQRWDGGLTSGWTESTRVLDTTLQANRISVPYAGIGYSSGSSDLGPRGLVTSSWSFSVDLGVMALAPRSAVRFGGTDGAQTRLDDLMRELRLAPMLQLGVSYSF